MLGRLVPDGGWRPIWLVMIGFAAAVGPSPGADAAGPNCEVPGDLMEVDGKLPHLAHRLQTNASVKIVALGGASSAGLAAGSAALSYPQRFAESLAGWYPKSAITLVNQSRPHQSAEEMLTRFPSAVFALDPTLVIWETGTTDAVRGVGVDAFAATLESGVDALAAHGIDLIMVDMQFSHRTVAVIDFDSYLHAMQRVGDVKDIYVFPRFAMMRWWSEQEVFDLDGVPKGERARLAADVYRCLGRNMAEAVRSVLQ